ncbi:androgen-induced gene 1 protein isoform X3 [Drosophila kikkawai]|uniref:Androgen-induced gene 1 protein isoform X3 n=1 Tax=Drosophila kikkawai TaxID=30033 RepID=A0ABM3C6N9_DROKI|nr:androgen-induced gene 1 protein isoform X2 [Drosophila kikkawai]XP_041632042.1 androgen-induced gene 1 protein isoform X2 [Drosophila kikkawai]
MTKVELYKSRVFVTIIHLCALGQFAYGLYYSSFDIQRSYKLKTSLNRRLVPESLSQKIKFLSYWSLIIQALYYTVSLVNDFVGTNELTPKKPPAVRRFKDWLMATLAFPVAINVGVTFWTLYAIDRELVFPKVLDPVFPSWLNHVLHTNIVVFIVLEIFTSYRSYPKRSQGLTGLAIFMGAYLVWIHVVKHYSGVWVYPVLEVLQLPQRILFFVAVIGFTLSLYLLGEFLNNTVWAKEVKLAKRKIN